MRSKFVEGMIPIAEEISAKNREAMVSCHNHEAMKPRTKVTGHVRHECCNARIALAAHNQLAKQD